MVKANAAFATASSAATAAAKASNKATLYATGARALLSNPVDLPPWSLPSAWAASTAITSGSVALTSAGAVYVCLTAGTTGTSAPTTTYPVQVADGTAYCAFVSGLSITASDAMAPTVTTGGQSALYGLGYTNAYYPATQAANFTLLDCAGMANYSGAAQPYGWPLNASGGTSTAGGAIAFETEAPVFAISYPYNGQPFRVMIDGRWHTIGAETMLSTQTGTTNMNYTLLTFPGGMKTRKVIIDCSNTNGNFGLIYGVHVQAQYQVRPVKVASSLAVIADSWGAGSGYDLIIGNRFPQQLARLLGFDQCYNYSIGGTGYVNPSSNGYYTFAQRIPVLIAALQAAGQPLPNLWVLAGSINDCGYTAAQISAGVQAAIAAIRASSSAPIVIFGVQPKNDSLVTATVTFTAGSNLATVTAISSATGITAGSIVAGQTVTSSGYVSSGTTVSALGTSTGGTGTITLSTTALVSGSTYAYFNANALISANEAAQQAGVTASGDALTFYVPCYGDADGPWISGTWNNAGRTGFANSGGMLGNDNTHSYDWGYSYWARRMENKIRSAVYPNL